MHYTINGKFYKTKKELCDYLQISTKRFNRRMKSHNETPEEAFNHFHKKSIPSKIAYVINGKLFTSKKSVLEYIGRTKSTVRKRTVKENKSFEDVCEDYLREKKHLRVRGKQFNTITEACSYIGITNSTLYKYMNIHKCTLHTALIHFFDKYKS